jgi:anaerobic ribonucleoside-triphosphate reductase
MNTKLQRQKCEVYSRVCGYLRPIQQWNAGKQAEYNDRKNFSVEKITEDLH